MPADLAVHRSSLYHFILKRVRDPWISEDLVQETLARLLTYARSQAVLDTRALGFSIATNLVRDHFRAVNRGEVQALTEDLVCDSPAQEQVSIQHQRIDAFRQALAAMPPLRREVFVRRRLRGESYSEIATALGLSHAAVEKHVVRALEWLHQEISKHDRGRESLAKYNAAARSRQRETPVEPPRTHAGRTRAFVAVTLLSLLAWLAWPWFDLALTPQTVVVVPPGQTRTMVLADGSRLELSGGTSLAARIGSFRRTVHLEQGEAFFTVAPDADRPFVVETADGRVQVRGTAFDLSQTRDGLELAVYHGRVAFSRNSLFTDAIDLVAGEKADLNDGVVSAVRHFDVDAGDWRSGWLQTDGITLGGLAERLGRRHNLAVQVDATLEGKRIAGRFRLNDPEALLRSLSVIHGFAVSRSDAALLVTPSPAET